MKKFSIKDFILYNGPCFVCKQKIAIKITYTDYDELYSPIIKNIDVSAPLSINKDFIDVILKVKYNFTLKLQLSINDNKFKVSNIDNFKTYINMRDLYLVSKCSRCNSQVIISEPLQFNPNGYVDAFSIMREEFIIQDENVEYVLCTTSRDNKTHISVIDPTKEFYGLDIPAVPLYKFRTKEKLLSKIKTYILFS